MSKFDDINDDELIEEVEKRNLEKEFQEELETEIKDLNNEIGRINAKLSRADNDRALSDIKALCESYRYDSESKFNDNAKQFLIDHGGLIA